MSETKAVTAEIKLQLVEQASERRAVTAWPKVSVLIAAFNRRQDVLANAQHLLKNGYPNLEIIVIDDGSTDGTAEALEGFPKTRVLRCATNRGPAFARNLGIRAATGKYVLFLDSDGFLGRRSLKRMVERMEQDPQLGIVGCQIVNYYTRELDQWIYAQSPREHVGTFFDTYSFSAAGAMARADVLEDVGGFWDRLRIYNEELDLSIRVLRRNYRIAYCPRAYVFHHTSPERRHRSGGYWVQQARNRIWILYRYYSGWGCLWRVPLYGLAYAAKGIANRALLSCLRGVWQGVREVGIYAEFPDKLTRDEVRKLAALNRRRRVAWDC